MFSLVERRRVAAGVRGGAGLGAVGGVAAVIRAGAGTGAVPGGGPGAGTGAAPGAGSGRSVGGWLAVVVAGALVLSGCSGSGEPDADAAETPSMSASATASESPSPSPSSSAVYKPASAEGPAENVPLPVMPEEAKVESKEGLIAFARHWYDLANYGYETGDVEPLKAISGPDCTACNGLYSTIGKGYVEGDWIAGATVEVTSIASDFILTEAGEYQVLVMFIQEPIEAYGPGGHHYNTIGEGTPYVQLVEAVFSDGVWTANEVVTVQDFS